MPLRALDLLWLVATGAVDVFSGVRKQSQALSQPSRDTIRKTEYPTKVLRK